jgi:protein O-GlcNAc transferase
MKRGAVFDAIDIFQNALQIDESSPDVWSNLAMAWQEIAETSNATECFHHAWQLAPGRLELLSNRVMASLYEPEHNSAELKQIAMLCQTSDSAQKSSYPSSKTRTSDEKLRIGFLSSDFRRHPVGNILRDVLPGLAQRNMDITLINTGRIVDDLTEKFRQLNSCTWVDIAGASTEEATLGILDLKLQVLMDLAGHTSGNRMDVLQKRVAPLQINWLGYPGACGYQNLDFSLFGEGMLTEGSEHFFPENIKKLNASQFLFSAPENCPAILNPPVLKNGYITFGSFNNTAKLNIHTIRLWARVLHAVEGSQLLIKWNTCNDLRYQMHLRNLFAIEGIDASRLELRGPSTYIECLEQYADVDVALDSWPFTGGITSMEGLWMGVPLVTLYSIRPVSRQGYSLLKAIELEELACTSEKAFVNCAQELANNPDQLLSYRHSLRQRMQESPLMDTEGYVQALVDCLT